MGLKMLTIITIHKGPISLFERTTAGFKIDGNVNYIFVVNDTDNILQEYTRITKRMKAKLLYNEDASLFNAMNVGLENVEDPYVMFINSGDKLCNQDKLLETLISAQGSNLRGHAEMILTDTASYIWHSTVKSGCHQAFVAYIEKKKIFFDESRYLDADAIWMDQYVKLNKTEVIDSKIAEFYFGGVSSLPKLDHVRYHLRIRKYKRCLGALIKLILYKSLGYDVFVKLWYFR